MGTNKALFVENFAAPDGMVVVNICYVRAKVARVME